MDRENELLRQLAERPFDRALRLVFADWLSERDDPRGEVITLTERGSLSLSERRRLARLTQEHAAAWLGPLSELAASSQCRFQGGFVSHLVCQTPSSPDLWRTLADEPRLATVTSLVLPSGPPCQEQGRFLCSPYLRELKRLQAGSPSWSQVGPRAGLAFTLEVAAVSSWGVFRQELEPMGTVEALAGVSRLDLVTSDFVNPVVVKDICESLQAQLSAWRRFREVRLLPRFGVVEGAAQWLASGAQRSWERAWRQGERWSVEYGETLFRLERVDGRFSSLLIDLAQHDDLQGLGQRISAAASVLVQLGGAGLQAVEIQVPGGTRLRASERDALRAAARRLGTIKSFSLGGVLVAP